MARLPLEFSAKPSREYPNPESVPHIIDYAAEQVKAGHFDKKTFKLLSETFQLVNRVSKLRLMQDQPFSRTLMGFNIGPHNSNQLANDFAGKDVTSTRQSDWIKSNEPINAVDASDDRVLPLSRYIVQAAFLLFIGDEALSILPLILHGLSMMDASAASTLDYSIRFLSDDFDFEQYHLRETRTIAAKHQRTYSEALIWDTSNRLVAVISQTCVARPKPNSASKM